MLFLLIAAFFVIGFLVGFIAAVALAIRMDENNKRNLNNAVKHAFVPGDQNAQIIEHPSVQQ